MALHVQRMVAGYATALLCALINTQLLCFADQPVSHHLRPGIGNFSMGQFDAALVEFKKAATETPRDPMVHYYLGTTQARLNQTDEAVQEFQKAYALAPPGSKVKEYTQAALAVYGQHSTDPRYQNLLQGSGPLPSVAAQHPDQPVWPSAIAPPFAGSKEGNAGSQTVGDQKIEQKELAQAQARAKAIEDEAEGKARQMQDATIRIGTMTVRRYTAEDIKEVRDEAKDRADFILREAKLKADLRARDLKSQAARSPQRRPGLN